MLRDVVAVNNRLELYLDYNEETYDVQVVGTARNVKNYEVYVVQVLGASPQMLLSVGERFPLDWGTRLPYPVNVVQLPGDTWPEVIKQSDVEFLGPGTINQVKADGT